VDLVWKELQTTIRILAGDVKWKRLQTERPGDGVARQPDTRVGLGRETEGRERIVARFSALLAFAESAAVPASR
jgi:hypothetical protein